MDYFKHYATASDSKSLNLIFDEYGHKGIAFWWMLVELCCENWDGKSTPEFTFHQRVIASKLKSSSTVVRTWLELCSNLGMCSFASKKSEFEIKLPKLLEVKTSRNVIKSNKTVFDVEENRIEENILKPILASDYTSEFFEPIISVTQKPKRSLENSEARQKSTLQKLSDKGSIVSPEWIVVEYFNAVNKRDIKQIDANYKLIKTRLGEGFTVDEMKLVIDHTSKNWTNDPFWSRLNRISTIFNGKFNDYLSEAQNAVKPKIDPLDAFFAQYEQTFSAEA